MNFRAHLDDDQTGIPIAPMVDVVFLLLIFFLVTWNFARYETELDVKVPTAREGKETRRSVGEVILNVKRDGGIVLNRREMSPESLKEALERIAQLYPDQAVVLRGDQEVDYKHIVLSLIHI